MARTISNRSHHSLSKSKPSSGGGLTAWIIGLLVLSATSLYVVSRRFPEVSNKFGNLFHARDPSGRGIVISTKAPTLGIFYKPHNFPVAEISPPVTDTPMEIAAVNHLLKPKDKGAFDMHFIHIPKCGGTSMTAILREVACRIDTERNSDCCLNPGFCDFHANRRCQSIRGCINHIPQR